jgi:hypothetical protein
VSIASAERVSSEMFCSSVFYEMMFLRTVGEKIYRGVLEKAEKYFLKLTSLVFVLAEREREREREMNARQREREREKGKERRDYLNVDI